MHLHFLLHNYPLLYLKYQLDSNRSIFFNIWIFCNCTERIYLLLLKKFFKYLYFHSHSICTNHCNFSLLKNIHNIVFSILTFYNCTLFISKFLFSKLHLSFKVLQLFMEDRLKINFIILFVSLFVFINISL
jgi:hypothetical protein